MMRKYISCKTKSFYDLYSRNVKYIRYEGCRVDIAADGTSSIAALVQELF
jgi:hypothetical protein